MATFKYKSGQDVRPGDKVLYDGEPGEVELVVSEPSGQPQLDWYLTEFPGGGIMISAITFGSVFVRAADISDNLEFVSRSEVASKT